MYSKKDVKKSMYNRVKPHRVEFLRKRARVLKLLSSRKKLKNISKELKHSSLSSIYRMFNRLVKEGMITEGRMLTDKGLYIVKNNLVLSKDVKLKPNSVRIHDLMFSIRILNKPKKYDYRRNSIVSMKVRDYKIIDLKNNYQEQFIINEIMIRTTTDHILIMFPDIYAESEPEGTRRAIKILMDKIPQIENLYKIMLIKENYCNIKVSRQHYALIYNQLAKLYRTDYKGNTFKVYDDVDGTARLIIDFSLGIPEFEAVHKIKSPEDINKCQKYFKSIIDKEHLLPSESKEMVEVNTAMIYELGQGLIQTNKQIGQILKILKPKPLKEIIPKEKPDYFG